MHEWGESIRWVRPTCPAGRERVRYTERLARSMGSDDDMFRIWSGPEGSSHKEPLSGIRIHRVRYSCAVLPNRAMLDAARHPGRQFVIQKAGHDQKVYALPFSCQLVRPGCRSLALPGARRLRDPVGGEIFGVSLVLGFACGIARLPNALPALAGCRPKPPEGSHLSDNLIPCLMLLVGVIWSAVAMWFMRRRCCLLFCK